MGLVWPRLGNKAKYQSKSTMDVMGGMCVCVYVCCACILNINYKFP